MFVRRVTKEYFERFATSFAINAAVSILPSVLGSIATSLKEIAVEEKFDKLRQSIGELEKWIGEIKKIIPLSPISTQVMLADVVLVYVDQDMEDALLEYLSNDLTELKLMPGSSMASVDDLVMSENCIALNMTTPSSPEEVEEVVESVRQVLSDYHVEVKAIACY